MRHFGRLFWIILIYGVSTVSCQVKVEGFISDSVLLLPRHLQRRPSTRPIQSAPLRQRRQDRMDIINRKSRT
ncbi:CXADR-like membrane protein [Lates japonicus]|uniref:CXADR-like membrane protein n=1 Tax=Lates japonicus TaxID=270547 RepID=A0AAD3NLC6_LATJO|nr:CXADR-like membrane protein [Lates japonicus]